MTTVSGETSGIPLLNIEQSYTVRIDVGEVVGSWLHGDDSLVGGKVWYNLCTLYCEEEASKMDELVELVQKKVGLSKEQATQAVNAVVGFLKKKLPDPIAKQLDGLLASEQAMDAAEDLPDKGMGALSGMLGKKGD